MNEKTFQWENLYKYDNHWGWCGTEHVIDTQELIEYIEKHGVNTKDSYNISIYVIFNKMTNDQIDIVFDVYHFNPLFEDKCLYLYKYITEKGAYVFKKLLQHDHDFKYLKYPVGAGEFGVISLREWFNIQSKRRMSYDKYVGKQMFRLYYDHYNKGISLFNLMLDNVDLNIDKKQRFH